MDAFAVFSDSDAEDDDCEDDGYLCEPCDRTFDYEDAYRKHMGEHQTCGIDGCKFNAHELLVMAHIKMQHSSGLYDKIRNISTPEDIQKWRLERKKNYPSKANIEIRYKMQEEMMQRGERIKPGKERFAKKNQVKKQKKKSRKKPMPPKTNDAPVSLIDEKADWNGTMFPFKGTTELESSGDEDAKEEFSDDEWEQSSNAGEDNVPQLNNALGALMGAYNSDESDTEKDKTTNSKVKVNVEASSSGMQNTRLKNEAAIEEKLVVDHQHNSDDEMVEEKILKEPVALPDKASEGKVAHEHRKRSKEDADVPVPPKKAKHKTKSATPARTFSRRPTLLQKLLDKEIRHERNVILQCVRYVINNNFFDDIAHDS